MNDLKAIERALKRPFMASQISWRVGAVTPKQNPTKGVALAYIDARDVMRRLDDVFGLFWQARYSHADRKTICEIGAKIDGEWIWRSGGAGDTDIEAEKGAISDAFKRAAVLWGVGRYLYELPNEWMLLDDSGKRLKAVPSLPKWATPEGFDEIMAKHDALDGKTGTMDPSRLQDMLDTIKACSTVEALAELKTAGLDAAQQAKDETAYLAIRAASNKRYKELGGE